VTLGRFCRDNGMTCSRRLGGEGMAPAGYLLARYNVRHRYDRTTQANCPPRPLPPPLAN
jgi:hypothetical protein